MDNDVPENENDETVEHLYVRCDKCRQEVRGVRYKCKICPDFDLCRTCKQAGQHSKHEFEAIVKPVSCDDVENFISAMKRFNVDGVTHILNNNTDLLKQFNYDHLQKLYSHFKHS
jgi:formate dehydrogenase maturation protein FdhE